MAKANTQHLIAIKDERLDIDRIGQYRLSFFISSKECQITVFDIQKKLLLLFENRELDAEKSIVENLEFIHKDHILVSAGFWKEIQVFVRNNQFSLIPFPVFDKSYLNEYVRLNEETDPNVDSYHFKVHEEYGVAVAFGYEQSIKDWFKEKYPKVNLFFNHQASAFLKGTQEKLNSKLSSSLFVSLNRHDVQIAGFNLSRLVIYNQFRFNDPKHLIKILLLTLKQYSDKGQEAPLFLYGLKSQVDANMDLVKKYFSNLTLGDRPKGFTMHPIFNELEEQEYFDVFANL